MTFERRGRIGIIANPMAGRDVRRVAARASEVTHQAKREMVSRIVAGADAAGAETIVVHAEPFRVSTGAVEAMQTDAQVEVVSPGKVNNNASDTVAVVRAMRELGVTVLVVLGGDGTNRIVAGAWPDARLVPVSTGTNNVFPVMVEPTLAGSAAALAAGERVAGDDLWQRSKVIRCRNEEGEEAIALIDAVLLRDDFVGNRLPVDANRIDRVLLTVAAPAAVGMSPVGGLVDPVGARDPFGLLVTCNRDDADRNIRVPVSPGYYRDVRVADSHRVEPGTTMLFHGPGVIAFDGDRELGLNAGEHARLSVDADGPWVLDIERLLHRAALERVFG